MPTFANLCGFDVPADRKMDGVDQTDLILGKNAKGNRNSFFYVNAVRQGKWKYLKPKHCMHGYARDRQREEVEELYDLEDRLLRKGAASSLNAMK